jgi:ribosomal protein S12 methylthiotransferase
LLTINDLSWIRFLYGYPEEIGDSLLEIMQEEQICSYLDLPFQHSHPSIVKRMGRGLDGHRALKLIQKIRTKLPDVALRTSLIVGFPGEERSEFENLHHFVREAEFEHMGVFTYSREQGTPCYSWGDPVKSETKNRRKDILMETQAEISYKKNAKYLGRTVETLLEGNRDSDQKDYIGRGKFQAPEVDGQILVEPKEKGKRRIGTIQKVEITGRDVYDLFGVFFR